MKNSSNQIYSTDIQSAPIIPVVPTVSDVSNASSSLEISSVINKPRKSKKALIITAHPSTNGFTHKIAEAYKHGLEKAGGEAEILDLYKTNLKQDFLRFESVREIATDSVRLEIQAKITEADELVFIHPLWWLGPPAIMKNFLDQNISARFAFKYVKGKRVGLLKGKSASVFITCDGSMFLYTLLAQPFRITWQLAVIFYCGMKNRTFKVFDKKTWRSDKDQAKFLEKVEKIGAKLIK